MWLHFMDISAKAVVVTWMILYHLVAEFVTNLFDKWMLFLLEMLFRSSRVQCRINANRGPWQLFARGPLLTRDKDLSKL